MYYLYKKNKNAELPKINYSFNSFTDFYELSNLLSVSIRGAYNINIKSDDTDDILYFIQNEQRYTHLVIYIQVSDSMLKFILLRKPGVSVLSSASNYELFQRLVEKYEILFNTKCLEKMYFAIPHTYADMDESLALVKQVFPNKVITEEELSQLFVLDQNVYPRSVAIAYLRMDRGRSVKLDKCVNVFGNDLVLYSIRKTVRKLRDEKLKYLKSGDGSFIVKTIPVNNLVKMLKAFDYERAGFMDVKTILSLYEKGDYCYDIVQQRTNQCSDEERYDA